MKGKKIEAAKSGVDYNAPLANNSKTNIMAAAKMRKRGGAVAKSEMPDGLAAMKRLDKPSRARKNGGKVGKHSPMHGMDKHDPKRAKGGSIADIWSGKSTPSNGKFPKSKIGNLLQSKVHSGDNLDKVAKKTAGNMLSAANADEDKPARKRGGGVSGKVGGEIGANERPISTANRTRPMRGHTTQPNIT